MKYLLKILLGAMVEAWKGVGRLLCETILDQPWRWRMLWDWEVVERDFGMEMMEESEGWREKRVGYHLGILDHKGT